MEEDLVVGLDIGTTEVCAVIGERSGNGLLEITGLGSAPSCGIRRGIVVNIESTLAAVRNAVEAAELMSGREVKDCWLGIGGASIESRNSKGVVAVKGTKQEPRQISEFDVERVLDAARAVDFPLDKRILEVIPRFYIVDMQSGIRNPVDMIGVRLEAEVNIITCSMTTAENLVKCVNRAGFRVKGGILQSLAAGSAVLSEEEKEMGVILIDLGGGKTDVLVYEAGAPSGLFSIPLGGNQVTNDISIVKNLAVDVAEKIKVEAGCCWLPLLEGTDEEIIAPGPGGRAPVPVTRSMITRIIQPRMEETFGLVKQKLGGAGITKPPGGGIVLTGGGANLLGVSDLASALFELPVRVGVPLYSSGLADDYKSPQFASAVGLVIEGDRRERALNPDGQESRPEDSYTSGFKKLISWIRNEFF